MLETYRNASAEVLNTSLLTNKFPCKIEDICCRMGERGDTLTIIVKTDYYCAFSVCGLYYLS